MTDIKEICWTRCCLLGDWSTWAYRWQELSRYLVKMTCIRVVLLALVVSNVGAFLNSRHFNPTLVSRSVLSRSNIQVAVQHSSPVVTELAATTVNLSEIGNDIVILPSETGRLREWLFSLANVNSNVIHGVRTSLIEYLRLPFLIWVGIVKIVMKFGGSSLATPERVTYVARYVNSWI